MDRHAIFIDAGYFFAAGAQAAFGEHTMRKEVALKSPAGMLADLCARASAIADNLPLLRTYWYDAMLGPRLSLEQSALAMLTSVKLRLGALNSIGEQKGVDSLIVTDLIDLARNRAIADAVVLTGDEDLRIAVQVAQSFGVRVHILAAGDPTKNVSPTLQMEADSVSSLSGAWFATHLERAIAPSVMAADAPVASPADIDNLDAATDAMIDEMLAATTPEQLDQLAQHFLAQQAVPPEYDRPLMAKISIALSGYRFSGVEMRKIRGKFVRAVKTYADSHKTR